MFDNDVRRRMDASFHLKEEEELHERSEKTLTTIKLLKQDVFLIYINLQVFFFPRNHENNIRKKLFN